MIFRSIYGAALRLMPREFRTRYAAEALRMASVRVAEERGARRLTRGVRELADLAASAPHFYRSGRGIMRDGFVSDLTYAVKSLARTRGFLAVSLGTLAAGLALSASVMVLFNAYLVRGLPYPNSDRLHWIRYGNPTGPFVRGLETLDWRGLDDVIEQPISWDLDFFNLRGAPHPEGAQGTWVTRGYMQGFGIRPAIGRAFLESDFATGAPPVAIISHRLWRTRFGGDPAAVGRTFEAYVNDRPAEPQTITIVGVLPADHWHLNAFTEILAPLRGPSHPYMATLRAGVDPAHAAGRIEALARAGGLSVPEGWGVTLESAHADYVRQVRPLLIALASATALVLLIACANVCVLFTVRASARRREIAVRKALGASTLRVTRALAAEAVVLGAAATALGLAAAHTIITLTAPLIEKHLGRSAPGGVDAIALDGRAIGGLFVAGLFVTLICVAAQLWASRRAPAALALHAGQKGASAGPQQRRAHGVLIAVEVAACLTLLVGAALMIQSSMRILGVDMGLDTRGVMVGRINLNPAKYRDAASRLALFDRISEAIDRIPGARGSGYALAWPLQAAPSRDAGIDTPNAALDARAGVTPVSPGYFNAVGIAIEDGRSFTQSDVPGSERVAIVSRTLAARLWPNQRAVGQRLRLAAPQAAVGAAPTSYAIVGVAADVRHTHTDQDLADVYTAIRQSPALAAFVYIRDAGGPAQAERAMREILGRADPDMALESPRALDEILDRQRAGARFLSWLLIVFAAFATVLALVGMYGVIAYTVRQREREIAVRIAIGADRALITNLFLRQGAIVLAAGLLAGVGGALGLGRLLESYLFGVRPVEPLAIAAVTAGFALCGLTAIGWPARRAASIDPALALKE